MIESLQFVVHFAGGTSLTSDKQSRQKMLEEAQKEDPSIDQAQLEEAIQQAISVFADVGKLETMSLFVDGRPQGINPKNVTWIDIIVEES